MAWEAACWAPELRACARSNDASRRGRRRWCGACVAAPRHILVSCCASQQSDGGRPASQIRRDLVGRVCLERLAPPRRDRVLDAWCPRGAFVHREDCRALGVPRVRALGRWLCGVQCARGSVGRVPCWRQGRHGQAARLPVWGAVGTRVAQSFVSVASSSPAHLALISRSSRALFFPRSPRLFFPHSRRRAHRTVSRTSTWVLG